jgi:hypothetical protein
MAHLRISRTVHFAYAAFPDISFYSFTVGCKTQVCRLLSNMYFPGLIYAFLEWLHCHPRRA